MFAAECGLDDVAWSEPQPATVRKHVRSSGLFCFLQVATSVSGTEPKHDSH